MELKAKWKVKRLEPLHCKRRPAKVQIKDSMVELYKGVEIVEIEYGKNSE